MKITSVKTENRSGFTLIEMAVVMVLAGIIISIIATVVPSLIQSGKIRQTRAIVEKVNYSLEGYISATGRCPCPDTDATPDGYENRNDGGTPDDASDDTCPSYVGYFPYLTIGLAGGNDNWNNRLKYGVYEDLIQTTSDTGSNNFCTKLSEIITYYSANPTDTGKLYTTDTNGDANKAFVLVSGGAKDLEQNGEFFDGKNSGTDLQFEAPGKIISAAYDDVMTAASFVYIKGRDCTGGTSSGTATSSDCSTTESIVCGNCGDGLDNDSDGLTDCSDSDCATYPDCSGTTCNIATSSIPSGLINNTYSATLTSTGCTGTLNWELTANGGFDDFFLHPYTGALSGTLSQCPGTYTISVSLTDSSSPTPNTDTQSYTISVTSNLSITRTSGDQSIDITWTGTEQDETFMVTGGHLEDINWTLDKGSASGAQAFYIESTGSSTCRLKTLGGNSAGTYNLKLTATDPGCSGGANTASINLAVTVPASLAESWTTFDLEAVWHFNECTTWTGAPDEVIESGGASPPLNGRAVNNASNAGAGLLCRAAYFDGASSQYLDMGDILTGLESGHESFTAAAWIFPVTLDPAAQPENQVTNHGTYNCFLSNASDPYNDNFEIGVNQNGTVHVYFDTVSRDTSADFGNAGAVATNRWTFIAVTYDYDGSSATTVAVTINGNRYANTSTWNNSGGLDQANGSPFTIGASQHTNNYFFGKIDEVMTFTRALTSDEIQILYDRKDSTSSCSGTCYTNPVAVFHLDETQWAGDGTATDVLDSSGNGYHGTYYNYSDPQTITSAVTGKLCNGAPFTNSGVNTENDRLKIPYQIANGLQDFSVAVWVKTTRTGEQGIVTGANTSQNNEFLLFLPNRTTIRPYLKGSNNSYSLPASIADDSWHHIIWMRDGSRETVYYDGTSLGSNTVSTAPVVINTGGLWLGTEQDSVGGTWAASQEFEGTLDEVYFYDRALSENEIQSIFQDSTCN